MKKKNAKGKYIWAWKHKQTKAIGLNNVCFKFEVYTSKNEFFTKIYFSACLGTYPKRPLGVSKGTLGNHLLP